MNSKGFLAMLGLGLCALGAEVINLDEYVEVTQGVEPKVVFQEDFEGKSNWSLNGATIGKHGEKMDNAIRIHRETYDDPYRITTRQFSLKPGRRYRLSCRASFKNLTHKSGNYMEFFAIELKHKNNYVGGLYPVFHGFKSGDIGWQEYSGEFTPHWEFDYAHIALYLKQAKTGTAFYDNIQVVDLGEPEAIVYPLEPKFLNPMDNAPIRCRVFNYGRGKELRIVATCNGQTVVEKVEDEEAFLRFDKFAPGKNEVVCSVVDVASKVKYGTYRFNLYSQKVPEHRIGIRNDGILIRDGKPFLPVGIYTNHVVFREQHIPEIRDAGFNFIMPYATVLQNIRPGDKPKTTLEMLRRDLDIFEENGMLMLASLKERHLLKEIDGIKGMEQTVPYIVNGIKDHKALMGWYITDENPLDELPEIIRLRELVSSNDPAHPVATLTDKAKDAIHYGATGDVFMGDSYPIYDDKTRDMARVRRYVEQCIKDSRLGFWMVPQAFNWGCFRKEKPFSEYRYPTEQEMRSMCLLAMNLGAKGYCFFSYGSMLRADDLDPGSRARFWPQVSSVVKLLRELEPFFISTESAPAVEVTRNTGEAVVEAKAYKAGNKLAVVVTSDGPGSVEAVLKVAGNPKLISKFGLTEFRNGAWRFKATDIASDVLVNEP